MGRRVFLMVLDSVGIGEAPDAEHFDDVGCDTFGTCVRSGRICVPNLERLGIFQKAQRNLKEVIKANLHRRPYLIF